MKIQVQDHNQCGIGQARIESYYLLGFAHIRHHHRSLPTVPKHCGWFYKTSSKNYDIFIQWKLAGWLWRLGGGPQCAATKYYIWLFNGNLHVDFDTWAAIFLALRIIPCAYAPGPLLRFAQPPCCQLSLTLGCWHASAVEHRMFCPLDLLAVAGRCMFYSVELPAIATIVADTWHVAAELHWCNVSI